MENAELEFDEEMLRSKAFMSLSNNAKVLYIYMRCQFKSAERAYEPIDNVFYFNKGVWIDDENHPKSYRLYKNGGQFARDLKQLVDCGFVEVVMRRKMTREKNVYRLVNTWKQF